MISELKKRNVIKLFLLLIFTLNNSVFAGVLKQEPDCKKVLTLDSGYFGNAPSNRGRYKFANNIEDMNSCIFNKIDQWISPKGEDNSSSRTLTFALGGFINYYSHYALEFTLHEFGHRGRDIALGSYYEWQERSEVPHLFYLQTLFTPEIHTSDELGDDESISINFQLPNNIDTNSLDWEMNAVAAGFTAGTKLSGIVADRMYYGHGKVTDFFAYSHDKLFPAMYDLFFDSVTGEANEGDVADLARFYEIKGWDIKSHDIVKASLISYFLSASTYSYITGISSFINGGNRKPKSLEYYHFRLPDVQAFYERGISYKIISGYRVNDSFDIPFSIEQVLNGEKQTEYSIGLNIQLNDKYHIAGQYILGKKSQGSFTLSSQFSNNIIVYAGIEYNEIRNIEGARNISSLEFGSHDAEFFLGYEYFF